MREGREGWREEGGREVKEGGKEGGKGGREGGRIHRGVQYSRIRMPN